MHQVAADDGGVLAPAKGERDVSRGMARRRQDAGMVADLELGAHDLGPFGFHDRQHAVAKRGDFGLGVHLRPVVEFLPGEHVARVRKGRHPTAIFQPRVPADVIDMQMRAHDEVDIRD